MNHTRFDPMTTRTINALAFLIAISFLACSVKEEVWIDYSNLHIAYTGRIAMSETKGAEIYWSGTSVKFNFEGESVSALLEDEKGDNYFNVIIDEEPPTVLRPDTSKRYYQLAAGLAKGKHTVEIFKRTEWDRGKTSFYGFQISGNPKPLPRSPSKNRGIEFYGNSITSGYAMEDTSGEDSPDSKYINNYLSYGAITARYFDADYHCISKSGIGITVSWFPQIMPEIYDRLDPTNPDSKWNFSAYSPDVVVVNLLQNDSWIVNLPDYEQFKMRFGTEAPDSTAIIGAYQQFVGSLRNHYPQANIICSLGCMDAAKEGSKWMDYIETAVSNLEDDRVYTHFMPYIKATAHPSVTDHEAMARSLTGFIEANIEW